MSTSQRAPHGHSEDFAQVYQDQLATVWRYVRTRVQNYHEAQDVTAEVFARAWRSWPSFDPSRGGPAPWLFRIAQRAVADWYRHRVDEIPSDATLFSAFADPVADDPESVVLSTEAALLDQAVIAALGAAMTELNDHERNCLALRFAGGLKLAEVGEVLGVSTGAAKMTVSRAMRRLARAMERLERSEDDRVPTESLEDLVEELVMGGNTAVSSVRLQELVMHLSVMHQPALPPDLPKRVAACVACADRATRGQGGAAGAAPALRDWLAARLGVTPFAGISWTALTPVCLACTIPLLLTPFLALGLSLEVTFGFHLAALATAPVILWLILRHFRRHDQVMALRVGIAGSGLVMTHLLMHLIPEAETTAPWLFLVTDQAGTGLLLAAAFLDWRATRQWLHDQRSRLALVDPAFAPGR